MSSLATRKESKGFLLAFCLCAAAALCIFVPFVVVDRGLFQYCGDFNSQQIPFYTYMNRFVKSSAGQWSWETDLGSSAVNSYSFYLLGSPFFWLTTLLPAKIIPFTMVPMFALKFGVAGFAAFGYVRRYVRGRDTGILCACLYALSGFTVYNTFFNHFVDCIALFPFLLWALDEYMYNGRRGVFALAVAVNALNNYFFFAGQIVFLFLYFFVKLAEGEYHLRRFAKFGWLAFESLLGVAMGCALLWPAVLSLKDNPRTIDLANGWGLLTYGNVQQYLAIFTSLFLPPDPPYLPSIYSEGVIKWTSMSAYLPVVSCVGVLAYLRSCRRGSVRRVLLICAFMAMVPVLNSSFYALNSSYYARWFYMPILLMCVATGRALENARADWTGAFRTVACITAAFALLAVVPKKDDGVWSVGVVKDQAQFWLIWALAMLGLGLLYAALRFYKGKPEFTRNLLCMVLGFSVLMGVVHVALGKFPQWDGDRNYRQQCYVDAQAIDWPDDGNYYRIDAAGCYDNVGLWTGKSCLQFFNSTVSPSIMDFYPRLGVKRDVSSKPDADIFALRGLLGVKYTLTPTANADAFEQANADKGWTLAFQSGSYDVYENANYIGMGFACDRYIRMDDLEKVSESSRAEVLVKGVGLSDEQAAKYAGLVTELTAEERSDTSYAAYTKDIDAKRTQAVSSFAADGTGFTAGITLQKESLVFFAVPYDKGFSAAVNGRAADIEEVSGGMCAVVCPAGEDTVVFTYRTPGFALSRAIALGGCAVFVLYCGWWYGLRRRKTAVPAGAPGTGSLNGPAAADEADGAAAAREAHAAPDAEDAGNAGQPLLRDQPDRTARADYFADDPAYAAAELPAAADAEPPADAELPADAEVPIPAPTDAGAPAPAAPPADAAAELSADTAAAPIPASRRPQHHEQEN